MWQAGAICTTLLKSGWSFSVLSDTAMVSVSHCMLPCSMVSFSLLLSLFVVVIIRRTRLPLVCRLMVLLESLVAPVAQDVEYQHIC